MRRCMVLPEKGDSGSLPSEALDLPDLTGEVEFAPDFDHKALRESRGPGGAPFHSLESSTVPGGSGSAAAPDCTRMTRTRRNPC